MVNLENSEKKIALAWQKLAENKFMHSTIKKDTIMTAIIKDSISSVTELKNRLKYKLYWSVFFVVLFSVILLFNLDSTDMILLLSIIVATDLTGFISMFYWYNKINEIPLNDSTLLQSLKENLKMIKLVLNIEKVWGTVFFTPAIIIGIFAGLVYNGRTLNDIITDPVVLGIGLIAAIIVTPFLIWSSNKMKNYAFGGLLKKLDENITRMETLS